jgi:hypothetical protein
VTRRPAAAAGLTGAVLAAALLSGCSALGALTAPSAGTSTAATAPTAGTTTATAPETPADTTAPAVVQSPSAAPVRLTPGERVATDSPAPRTTDVVLSFAGWNGKTAAVEAGGYLSPVVESGGTCTLALTKGGHTVTAVAPALADATTTSCGNLSVPRARLTAGTWSAVLRYASKTTAGASDPMPVTVPQ